MNFVERRELLKLIKELRMAGAPPAVAGHVIWETKGGHSVRIVCTDRAGLFPIIGYFVDGGDVETWTRHGRYLLDRKHNNDLKIPDGFTVGEPDKTEAGEG